MTSTAATRTRRTHRRRRQWSIGLTTSYLTELGQQLLPHFGGVTSCDTIDLIFPHFETTRSCIINLLEKHYSRGGHWIGLFFDAASHTLFYWDPYGLRPTNKHILDFLKRAPSDVKYYPQRVQGLFSVYCGFHVLSFLLHKELALPTATFFGIYDQHQLHLNDDISVEFIKSCAADVRSSAS